MPFEKQYSWDSMHRPSRILCPLSAESRNKFLVLSKPPNLKYLITFYFWKTFVTPSGTPPELLKSSSECEKVANWNHHESRKKKTRGEVCLKSLFSSFSGWIKYIFNLSRSTQLKFTRKMSFSFSFAINYKIFSFASSNSDFLSW